MRKENASFSWNVKLFDVNERRIVDYNVLKYREEDIKRLKKKCSNKEEFAEKLCVEMMYTYWSRAEYELIIRLTDDGRVVLLPWCGCFNPEAIAVDVTDDESFDWKGFAEKYIKEQIYGNKAKIDVFLQLYYVWDDFVNYCWSYKHKYQRKKMNER